MRARRSADLSATDILLLPFKLAAALLDLLFCIPLVGRAAKWVWNTLLSGLHLLGGLLEAILWQLNLRPRKILRIGFLILSSADGQALVQPEQVLPAVRKTEEIFAQANIEVRPAFPPPKRLSEDGAANEAGLWARSLPPESSKRLLKVGCNRAAVWQDIGLPGAFFQFHTLKQLFDSGLRRLSGYGAPVTVFVVEEISGFGGCSLGWLSDYVTVKSTSLLTTAHELGHACNLLHRKDPQNLMHPYSVRQPAISLTGWQIALLRASRHVTLW